jgi:hypothetical protein
VTDERLERFIVPIDSIEKVTGMDLFSNMYGDWNVEINMEKITDHDPARWPFNEKWYNERIKDQ